MLAIACASWQVNEVDYSNRWRNKIIAFDSENLLPLKIMNRSWNTKPFIDMIVTRDTKCPDSHPDEVVYETWLGSKGFCDCLRDENF